MTKIEIAVISYSYLQKSGKYSTRTKTCARVDLESHLFNLHNDPKAKNVKVVEKSK